MTKADLVGIVPDWDNVLPAVSHRDGVLHEVLRIPIRFVDGLQGIQMIERVQGPKKRHRGVGGPSGP